MERTLHLKIVACDGVRCEAAIESASFPGTMAPFTVLPGHAPMVAVLEKGTICYTEGGELHQREIGGGFFKVSDNRILVCIKH